MRAAAAPWKNDKGGASLILGDFEVASSDPSLLFNDF